MGFPVAVYSSIPVRVFVCIVSAIESLAKSFFFSFFFASSLMCANNNAEEMVQTEEEDDNDYDTSSPANSDLPIHHAFFSPLPWPCHSLIIPFLEEEEEEVGQCSVCLEDLRRDLGRLDGCGHVYHMACIGEWTQTRAHSTCPLCRCQVAYC